jgi:hypothetical protein
MSPERTKNLVLDQVFSLATHRFKHPSPLVIDTQRESSVLVVLNAFFN